MSKELIDRLFPDQPFFTGGTYGVQGGPMLRHPPMSATIHKLAQETRGRRLHILEVGSYAGFSTLTWAQSIAQFCPAGGDILCVDPWAGYVDDTAPRPNRDQWAIMQDDRAIDDIYNLFRHNIATVKSPNISIQHIRAQSAAVLPMLRRDYFDLVYVDGAHVYTPVLADLQLGAPLVREGGFIGGDDLELQFHEVDQQACRANKDRHYMKDSKTQESHHPGVTLAVHEFFGGPVSTVGGYFYMRKVNGEFARADVVGCQSIIPDHFPPEWRAELQKRV